MRVASSWAIKATFAKSDVLAAYLVLGFPLLLCQLVNSRTRHGRDFWLVATTVSFTSILLTQDFLGLLALLVACAVFLAYASSRTVPLLICIFLIPVLVIGDWDDSATLSRTYEPIRDKLAKEVRVLRAAPVHQILLGTGPKSLDPHPGQEVRPRRDQARVAADNAHLSLILEMGILGWLAMLAILAVALRGIQQGIRRARDPYERSLMCAIFASAVGFLISMSGVNVFFQISLQVFFWGLIGLGLGVAARVAGNGGRLVNIWRFGDERRGRFGRGSRGAAGDRSSDEASVGAGTNARDRSDADLAGAGPRRVRAEHPRGRRPPPSRRGTTEPLFPALSPASRALEGAARAAARENVDLEKRSSYARRMRVGVPGCAILVVAGIRGRSPDRWSELVRIAKVENGIERVLASANLTNPARGKFFLLRREATTTGLSLELDGVRKLSVSESGFAPGSPGVLVGAVSGRVAHRIDNFSASVP